MGLWVSVNSTRCWPSLLQAVRLGLGLLWVLAMLPGLGYAARAPGYERYGSNEGLASGEVVSITEDREGYLWVASFTGDVHRFNGHSFEHFGLSHGLASQRIKRLHQDRNGQLRIATLEGVYLFERGRFVKDPRLGNAAIFDVLETRAGDFWLATDDGAVMLRSSEVLRVGVRDGLPMANATALAEGPNGEIWIGTTEGLARFADGKVQTWTKKQAGMPSDYITRLLVDKQGVLWIATDWGVTRHAAGQFANLDLGVDGQRLYVLDLLLDRRDRLRIATLGAGVLSWDGSVLTQLGLEQGLPSANIWSLAQSRGGGLWIGTQEHGLLLREQGPFDPVISSQRLASAVPLSMARLNTGEVWVGTSGAGMVRIEKTGTALPGRQAPPQTLTVQNGLPSDFVRRLLPDGSGMWIGTTVGLAYFDGQKSIALDETHEPWPVRDLLSDSQGGLWMVNKEQGLVHYQRHQVIEKSGELPWQMVRFPDARNPTPAPLWSMTQDAHGRLWLGATSAVFVFDGTTFQRWPAAGLSNTDRIVQLLFDDAQQIWFRSDEAIGCLNFRDGTPAWSLLKIPRIAWLQATPQREILAASESGLYRLRAPLGRIEVLGIVTPAEGYPRSVTEASGTLWNPDGTLLIGSADGVFRYDPTRTSGPTSAHVHLHGLRVNGEVMPLPSAAETLILRHEQNAIAIAFDATAFPAPETIEFRYRLEGMSETWSPPTVGRSAFFQNLAPGRFRVQVQARHGGNWDGEARSGQIEILPAYWQTWWFRMLLSGFLLAMATAIPLLRSYSLSKQRDQLERVVAERTAELSRYSGQLEHLVAARTSQLDRTYQELLARESERNRAAEALAAANRQASLGRMAGVVAHQVNTPLAAIKARISILRDEPTASSASESSLAVIDRQVDRIARIVRVLLGFVRQREQKGEAPSISAIVQSVTELYTEAFNAKKLTFLVVLPSKSVHVPGAIDDLQELLLNLLENAREAVPSGGQICLIVERQKDQVRLILEDDGPGLGNHPEQLFQPFFTTKVTGTGLGLAISRRIAETLGGSLTGENRFPDGHGARFILTLPIVIPHQESP